jgi:hypothetical protein
MGKKARKTKIKKYLIASERKPYRIKSSRTR